MCAYLAITISFSPFSSSFVGWFSFSLFFLKFIVMLARRLQSAPVDLVSAQFSPFLRIVGGKWKETLWVWTVSTK